MHSRNIELVAFDLDGTLIRGESTCEVLARHLGLSDEMRAFEKLRDLEDIKKAREQLVEYYQAETE